jgi:transportin-3
MQMTLDLRVQLQPRELPAIREKLLALIKRYAAGPKHTRVQLVLSLAILAIYMTEWKDVIEVVVAALGNDPSSGACILDFLRYLAEELLEGRKITLSVRPASKLGADSPWRDPAPIWID